MIRSRLLLNLRGLAIVICASSSIVSLAARSAEIPDSLKRAEFSPLVSAAIKTALSDVSVPCALGDQHKEHEHNALVKSSLLAHDSVSSVDSARKLIFSEDELTSFQVLTLIETLGDLNAADTNKLLRSIYQHAKAIAERYVDEDIDDRELKSLVLNSNTDDIRLAVVSALSSNKSRHLDDLLMQSASGESLLAQSTRVLLKQKNR